MTLTPEQIKAVRESPEYRYAFDTALRIHRQEHNPSATHFRDCIECKSGFALLLLIPAVNKPERDRT